MKSLRGKSFLRLLDFSCHEINYLIDLAAELKQAKKIGKEKQFLRDKNVILIFEKDSTRTRSAFDIASLDQGATVTYIGPSGSQIGRKESMKDTARVLGRMYHGIEYRGYKQEVVNTLAQYSQVPVWNGLTDDAHPTQALADLFTMKEVARKPFKEIKICFIGAANNNVANSLMVGCIKLGVDFRVACPKELAPDESLICAGREQALKSGAKLLITQDIAEAVKGCDFIYTDVWLGMGECDDLWESRIKLLQPYQVNSRVMQLTGNPKCKFMHCLPAFHNTETEVSRGVFEKFGIAEMEVTDEVFESEASVVFDQAENRMHTIKAVMVATLGAEG